MEEEQAQCASGVTIGELGIIEEILRRVPVMSLVRFLCVSKEWRSLISDPAFLRKHISCTGNPHLWKLGRICKSPPQQPRLPRDRFSMYTLDGEGKHGNTSLDNLDRPDVAFMPIILGSCNGLLLVMTGKTELVFWNPCSGSSRSIRVPCPCLPKDAAIMSGLAYDGESDDYKAVLIVSHEHGQELVNTHVFSYRRNSWTSKDLSDFPFKGTGRSYNGITVNCSPHWVVEEYGTMNFWLEEENALMCFDATKEELRKVPMLRNMLQGVIDLVEVGELNGCLSVAVNSADIKIWTMREYGVVESWRLLHAFRVTLETSLLRPIGYWTTDGREELVLQEGRVQLVAVDVQDASDWSRKVEQKIIKEFADPYDMFAIYSESIVSPWGL